MLVEVNDILVGGNDLLVGTNDRESIKKFSLEKHDQKRLCVQSSKLRVHGMELILKKLLDLW